MQHPFLSYRTGFFLAGIALVFMIGTLAGTQLTPRGTAPSENGLLTDLKTVIAPDALAGWNSGNEFWEEGYLNWPQAAPAAENSSKTLFSSLIQKSFASTSIQNYINPTCLNNFQSWNSSTTRKTDAPWSTMFMEKNPTDPNKANAGFTPIYFSFDRDINGDGWPCSCVPSPTRTTTG